ncbi:hypothetical protein SUGI_1033940 [Cryptomeria japonica]|uniref:uncharacterized protein LOC131056459 n=1 Tax=Cryptomeria japonica TaxID=3369 RepID=UPI0024149887|nr:uncharacterized protein LOC131056459 [Cryptomeria japonica]GLJ49013.1 hypothetical protein SUGI_1033940 [Cryptomeria japonica]
MLPDPAGDKLKPKPVPVSTPAPIPAPTPASAPNQRKANPKPKPITKVNNDKKGTNIVGSTASATNVGNIVNSVIDTTHATILSEITVDDVKLHGKNLGPIVAGEIRKRLGPELESLMMVLKNAAYTQGFTSGIGSRSPSR